MEKIQQKLIIVGDGQCGKTCLLVVFTSGEFPKVFLTTKIYI
jgi:GTPase SAR1 family protein